MERYHSGLRSFRTSSGEVPEARKVPEQRQGSRARIWSKVPDQGFGAKFWSEVPEKFRSEVPERLFEKIPHLRSEKVPERFRKVEERLRNGSGSEMVPKRNSAKGPEKFQTKSRSGSLELCPGAQKTVSTAGKKFAFAIEDAKENM